MPVDFWPMILFIVALTVIWITVRVVSKKNHDKGRLSKVIPIAICVSCLVIIGSIYVKLYWWVEWKYKNLASSGDVNANYILGSSYMSDLNGSPYNPQLGIKMLEVAGENGHELAQMELGSRFALGIDVPFEKSKSIKWLKMAEIKGNVDAKQMISMLERKDYKNSSEIPKELEKIAFNWIN